MSAPSRHALAASTALARIQAASPMSDDERLLVVCMRKLARGIADGTRGLAPADADQFVALEVFDFIDSLGGVSQAFALETARYLTDAVHRFGTPGRS